MSYAEIAFPFSVPQTFWYEVPEVLKDILQVGHQVTAPFGRRRQVGIVMGFATEVPTEIRAKLRSLENLLDPVPVFTPKLVELLKWMGRYYFAPLGQVVQIALPAVKQLRREVLVRWSGSPPPETETEARQVYEDHEVKLSALKKRWGEREAVRLVARWQRRGWVRLENVFTLAPKGSQAWVRLIPGAFESVGSLERAPAQQRVMEVLSAYEDGLWLKELQQQAAVSSGVIKRLVERGILQLEQRFPENNPLASYPQGAFPSQVRLTPEQKKAVSEINLSLEAAKFQPFLLHGVTGSGKTEVYLAAAEKALTLGRSVLILVPEIALAPQIARRFQIRHGNVVTMWHSNLRAPERVRVWHGIRSGRFKIVVGARSAVLTPLRNLGLIVVDEEQEHSYKQEHQPPRYNARDCALMRAKLEGAVIVLGSATPSLETYYQGVKERYQVLHLSRRWEGAQAPLVELVDMRKATNVSGDPENPFSNPLLKAMEETLASGHQVILLQNRRGYAPVVKCSACGWIMRCPHDEVSLTFHKVTHRMLCHYCGYEERPPTICPQCQGESLFFGGTGTQRVEEFLRENFPGVSLCRMDQDTTRWRDAHLTMLGDFARGKYQILLGTQMIAKGLDFENVTLVGVINADTALSFPDFRARERTFQLVYQVAGRSGRGRYPGRVIIQTWQPDDYAIRLATQGEVKLFYNNELNERLELFYPPFSRFAAIGFLGPQRQTVMQAAQKAALRVKDFPVQVRGPSPALVERSRKGYHWKLLLATEREEDPGARQLRSAIYVVQRLSFPKEIKLKIDMDPLQPLD